MPELPEVEVVRAGLAPALTGARILAVAVHDERALTRHAAGAADFVARLEGSEVVTVARRGKFLWMPLATAGPESSSAIVGHLGMSGQLLLRRPDAPAERHERIRLFAEHPQHGELAVVFADQRTFGSLAVDALVPTSDGHAAGWGSDAPLLPSQVSHIARDPMDEAFQESVFRRALRTRSSAIKRVLLDQNLISGVGNIYADESLWAARIHPETPASVLSTVAANRLLAEVRAVLEKALAEGGTSFDAQYVNVNGEAGYFAHSLEAYGREGIPCSRCGTPIKRVSFMNRSSHFCPRCQRRR
ncbi:MULTISPECIES: bifunctional DNA-formamidopyrimidine glycosylase/DNA-(apurinic or apyrimidinic site) lyase [unclassified Microbacterium]|uniref:bifunctional DNA-formamidopyrimidine glycosylase/DNA-(apurinic or apyrimidinic site) lyase n=1 Tax=unclassified Microbacterium TaxID=2609290 RepID=UPI00365D4E8C